jgi:CRP-like cAMP-binding protein
MERLGAGNPAAQAALSAAITRSTPIRIRRELATEGRDQGPSRAIVSGWAARVRLLLDGRRQFVSFLVPGDIVGSGHQPDPIASSTVIAITDVAVALLPEPASAPGLAHAYATSAALE